MKKVSKRSNLHFSLKHLLSAISISLLIAGCVGLNNTQTQLGSRIAQETDFFMEEIRQFDPQASFICVSELSARKPVQARQAFQRAEQQFARDIALSDKIALYDRALALGETKALPRILMLYETYADYSDGIDNENGQRYAPEIEDIYVKIMQSPDLNERYTLFAKLLQKKKVVAPHPNLRPEDYLHHAALKGDPEAQLLLGDYYLYVEGDYQKGKSAYHCALKQNNASAHHALAVGYEIFEENYPKAIDHHLQAADHGSLKSLLYLRTTFRDGLNGYAKNQDLADCFDNFYRATLRNPYGLKSVSRSCRVPNHPTASKVKPPTEQELNAKIRYAERQFNPRSSERYQGTLPMKFETFSEEELRKERLLKALKNKQLEF